MEIGGDMQTKQQKRANFALKKINEYKSSNMSATDFHDLAKLLLCTPNMILSNGLGQTLAFLLSKKEKKHKITFIIIKEWLQDSANSPINIVGNEDKEFLTAFSEIDQKKYIDAQNETLRLMEWLKRYARAFDDYEE